jgi:hypothetical protein
MIFDWGIVAVETDWLRRKERRDCHLMRHHQKEHDSKDRLTKLCLHGLGNSSSPRLMLNWLCPGTVRRNPSLSNVADVLWSGLSTLSARETASGDASGTKTLFGLTSRGPVLRGQTTMIFLVGSAFVTLLVMVLVFVM